MDEGKGPRKYLPMYKAPYINDQQKLGQKHKHSFRIAQTSIYLYALRDSYGWMVSLNRSLICGKTCNMYFIFEKDFEHLYNATKIGLERVMLELESIDTSLHSALYRILNEEKSKEQQTLKPHISR